MKILTICIVTKNDTSRLSKTLASLLELERHNICDVALLILNGGSRDGVEELVQAAEFDSISIVHCHDNGVYDAMNRCIAFVETKYYMYLNCGDSVRSYSAFKDLLRSLTDSSDEEVIFYGPVHIESADKIEAPPIELSTKVLLKEAICHQSMIIPTRLGVDFPLRTEFKIKADHDFCLRVHHKADFRRYSEAVFSYEGNGISDQLIAYRAREHLMILWYYSSLAELSTVIVVACRLIKQLIVAQARCPHRRNYYADSGSTLR